MATQTDLFAVLPIDEPTVQAPQDDHPLPERVREVIESLKRLLAEAPTSLCAGYSGGKDSTVVASLMLAALAEAREEGLLWDDIPHVVLSADTGVENPLVSRHLIEQHVAMRAFAERRGVSLLAERVEPPFASSFQVSVLGGRRVMPSFGMSAGCSQDWKVSSCQKRLRQIHKTLPKGVRCVTLLGSRRDEGARRSAKLDKQGARAGCEVVEHDGKLLAYPVLDFSTQDIFDYLLMAQPHGGPHTACPTYADNQAAVLKIYSDSMGGGCSLLAADTPASGMQSCSARTGCFVCQMNGEEDASLQNMVEKEAPHLRPLVEFRAYLQAVTRDPMSRNYLGTLPGRVPGTVNGGATGYAGHVLLTMVRVLLSMDANEAERAAAAGEEPAFQILTPQHIVAIDYMWATRGLQQRPFEALRAWVEIHEQGQRYGIPEVHQTLNQVPRPAPIQVEPEAIPAEGSLVSPLMAAWGVTIGSERSFEVDEEGAELLIALEADRLLAKEGHPETAASTLTGYGTVRCSTGKLAETDIRLSMIARLREAGLLEAAHRGGPVQGGGDLLAYAA